MTNLHAQTLVRSQRASEPHMCKDISAQSTQCCLFLPWFLSLSVSLMDVEVGGRNVYACGSFGPPVGLYVWAGQSVRRLEKAGSFFFFIFEVSKHSGSNDFITAVRDGGGLYVEGRRCVCVWGGGGSARGEHLAFFSITLYTWN